MMEYDRCAQSADFIRQKAKGLTGPELALICGSGLCKFKHFSKVPRNNAFFKKNSMGKIYTEKTSRYPSKGLWCVLVAVMAPL